MTRFLQTLLQLSHFPQYIWARTHSTQAWRRMTSCTIPALHNILSLYMQLVYWGVLATDVQWLLKRTAHSSDTFPGRARIFALYCWSEEGVFSVLSLGNEDIRLIYPKEIGQSFLCNAVEPSSWIHVDAMMYKIHTLTDGRDHVWYIIVCSNSSFVSNFHVLKIRGLRVLTKIYSPRKFLSIQYIEKTLCLWPRVSTHKYELQKWHWKV